MLISQDYLCVRANVYDQPDFIGEIWPLGEHYARRIRAHVPRYAGQKVSVGAG